MIDPVFFKPCSRYSFAPPALRDARRSLEDFQGPKPCVQPVAQERRPEDCACEVVTALETALDARRQRILISQSQVNLVKWSLLFMQALVAIAMVHSDNRLASIIAMGIFATGVAASMLLILAHDRPFTGEISIKSDPLLQVMPQTES